MEDLRLGDLVQTVLGEAAAPIIWIGRREIDYARHPKPRQVWPIRVAARAFGPGRPHTELLLSRDHAVYVGTILIQVRQPINPSTITQVPMDQVTYYHLEPPQHDVVLAQGLPAESSLDLKDGSNYANRPGPIGCTGRHRPHVGGIRLHASDRHQPGTDRSARPGRTFRRREGCQPAGVAHPRSLVHRTTCTTPTVRRRSQQAGKPVIPAALNIDYGRRYPVMLSLRVKRPRAGSDRYPRLSFVRQSKS